MPTQPKSSPLDILNHEFTTIELSASESNNPEGELKLTTERRFGIDTKNELQRFCELTVHFGSVKEEEPAPYTGKITVTGVFLVSESFSEAHRDHLIHVTATSILYGACREMLANLTARSTHGMLSLPSVSFYDPDSEIAKKAAKASKKTAKKKTAKKTTRKRAKKS